MPGYEEILSNIRKKADAFQYTGQNELWADAEGDFEQYQNWHNDGENGRCPIALSKYTGETDAETEETETAEFETVEEKVAKLYRVDPRIQRLLLNAYISMGREDFDEAERLIKEALEIDPTTHEAKDILKHIQAAKSEKSRKMLIYTLKYVDDVGPLKIAIDNARNELAKNPDDEDIARLLETAKARFDEIRKVQGQLTYACASNEYFTVCKGIAMLEAALDAGQTTFYDERIRQVQPIEYIMSDLTSLLAQLALSLVQRKFSLVDAYMPAEGKRNPKSALETLKECVSLKGIEANKRTEIETRIMKVSEEVVQWEKAEKELNKAVNPQLNDFERFQFFLTARSAYPHHSDVIDHERDYAINASLYLTEILDNSIARHSNLLAHEASAALDQRIRGHAGQPLPLFDNARQEIQDILIKVIRIPEEHATGRLLKTEEKAKIFLAKLEKVENRRKEIRSIYLRISDETRRNLQTGITSLESLDSATLEDPEIKYLRDALKLNLNIDGHIKIAKKQFESGKFIDCIDELCQIKDPGSFSGEIDQLIVEAETRLKQEQYLKTTNSRISEQIKNSFRNTGISFQEEVYADGTIADFYIKTPESGSVIFEVKNWEPTELNLARAKKISKSILKAANVNQAFVIIPGISDIDTNISDGIISIDQIASVIRKPFLKNENQTKSPIIRNFTPKNSIFVAMPLKLIYEDTYKVAIEPACSSIDAACIRVDNEKYYGDINIKIKTEINKCDLVIADISESNANVFFELGYALGLKKPYILLCSTPLEKVPFDIRHDFIICYKKGMTNKLKEEIEERLRLFLPSI